MLLLDKNLDRLRWVDQIHKGRIMTLASNRGAVERAVRRRRPRHRRGARARRARAGRRHRRHGRVDAAGRGDRRLRDRPGRLHRGHPRDDARRSGVRGRTACCTTPSATSPARCRTRRRTRSPTRRCRTCVALATQGVADATARRSRAGHGREHRGRRGHEPRGGRGARARVARRSPTRCTALTVGYGVRPARPARRSATGASSGTATGCPNIPAFRRSSESMPCATW